jgi:hypothetical protein
MGEFARCECGGTARRVQFSKPGNPQFKGEGWGADGYTKKGIA